MNDHKIHGRLVRDPELTRGADEKHDRCNFTVAVDRHYGDETDFFDCVIFGKRAGVIERFFSKGSEIVLSGEGQIRSYEDKIGVKRRAYSIVVSDFDFCGTKKGSSNNVSDADVAALEQAASDLLIPDSFEDAEGDIPF